MAHDQTSGRRIICFQSVRVQALIKAGRLPAQKRGRDWYVKEDDLLEVYNRQPGRPAN